MGKKNIFILVGIILIALIVLVMAVDWTPQGNINLRDYYNITNVPYYNGTDINITGLYYGNGSQLTGIILNWTKLQNYPVGCPANTFVTQIDDSITCTAISDVYLLNTGDTSTGDISIVKNNPTLNLGDSLGGGNFGFIRWVSATDSINLGTTVGGTWNNQITLLESGNVGIGTTTPQNKLNVIGDGNFTGNLYGSLIYGETWYHNHTATPINFAVDGLYYNLTFDNSLVNGVTFNDTGDYLEIDYSGVYKVSYSASGDGQNNHLYYTDVTVNGAVQDKCESHKKMTAGGDIVTMVGSCLLSLNVGDKIRLATADIGGTGEGNYYSSNLNLVRIGND